MEAPATPGVAIEVPAQLWVQVAQLLVDEVTCSPVLATSGLMRPSLVGPKELKPAMPWPLAEAAPTVRTSLAVDGGMTPSPPTRLPAAKRISSSCLPGATLSASRVAMS